jgi:hypothetical protein
MRVVVVFVVLGASACDVFETRTAEAPGGEGSTWLVPNVPSRVFLNMQSGLEELTGTNYVRSIQDGFTFEPLPEDANQFPPGHFDDWNADVEKEFTDRLVAQAFLITAAFTNLDPIRDQSPFADFQGDYELFVVFATVPPDTQTYKGRAQFDTVEGSKGWQLVRWVDIERAEGFASWGFLRGTLKP